VNGGGVQVEKAPAPVYLVRGDDPSLVAQAARRLIEELVGDRDQALVVEEHGGPAVDELDVGAVVDACTTPPFLASADAARLVAYVQDPLPSTVLVLVAGGGTVPASLPKAVAAAGSVVDTAVGTGRERRGWLAERLRDAPLHLDAAAAARLSDHLGDDLGRLAGLLRTLAVA
jgi:DNA polymerase III delta subunit